jgi:hypothetical protein
MERRVADFLADVRRWARARQDIHGVALVGSYAAGTHGPQSDIDLVIVAVAPEIYQNADWVAVAVGGRPITGTRSETFGDAWSLFVKLAEYPEIEFTFAGPAWASTGPPREEVAGIVRQGFLVLHDPLGKLDALSSACRGDAQDC